MKRIVLVLALTLASQPLLAQWDLVTKGARMARALTRDFTVEEEVALGRVVAARVLATYPLADDDKLQKYVTLVGKTVALQSSRPDLAWHFAVIETDMVNAFSCPGGYVFITTGAVAQIGSEAELAVVLGHEIAHATEKHILKEIKRAGVVTEGMSIASEQAGAGMGDALARKVSDLAYQKLFNTGIGRKEELEADRVGIEIAAAAGYRSDSYIHFLEALHKLASANNSSFSQLASTHPKPDDRLKVARAEVSDEGAILDQRWKQWVR